MTKQEEIRERIAVLEIGDVYDMAGNRIASVMKIGNKGADKVLSYLHSQGVVIKVDRELPETHFLNDSSDAWTKEFILVEDMAGYVAVEPLI